jgi:hypothetical protein
MISMVMLKDILDTIVLVSHYTLDNVNKWNDKGVRWQNRRYNEREGTFRQPCCYSKVERLTFDPICRRLHPRRQHQSINRYFDPISAKEGQS